MWVDHSISSWPDREALVVAVVRDLGLAASVLQGGAARGHPSPELRQVGSCESVVVPVGYVLRRTKTCRQLLTTKPGGRVLTAEARSRSRPSA